MSCVLVHTFGFQIMAIPTFYLAAGTYHGRDYSSPVARALHQPRRAPRLLVSGRTRSTSTSPCAATTRLWPHALYVDLAMRRDYSSPAARALRRPRRAPRLLVSGCTRSTSTLLCAATTRRPVAPAAAIYLDYAARPGASAHHTARHAARRAARRRPLVVDYFASATHPGASARHAARHAARRAARR
jgi:hypothetical protein